MWEGNKQIDEPKINKIFFTTPHTGISINGGLKIINNQVNN